MTFSPFSRLSFTSSSPMTTAVVGISLVAVGTAIYLSPAGTRHTESANGAIRPSVASLGANSTHQSGSPHRSATPSKTPSKKPSSSATHSPGRTKIDVIHAAGRTDVVVLHSQTTVTSTATRGPTKIGPVAIKHCANFTWQQDAQAAYLANLSDPGALDGAAGPHNGDGIACNNLLSDPARPLSTPVDPYVAPTPTAASKATLAQPSAKYFGVAQDGLPGDSAMFDRLSVQAGKAPSSVGWFSGFDSDFGSAQVTAAWSRGALPVITWMSTAANPASGHTPSEYTLSHIINGDLDGYLTKYAGDIVRTNLPVVIRFDHEMNGNWYPWSAGMYNNTPAKFVEAWRHIWTVFNNVGANSNVIWLWSPSRIDNLKPHATTGGGVGQTDLAEDYPGDQYVDWVGASMYLRVTKTGPTYSATFGKTVSALEALCNKPLFIPETAAVETDSTTGADVSALKAEWIANAFAGFLADPRIVGFLWFNNPATATVNGVPVTNNWRIDSSTAALSAFQRGVSSTDFSSGTMPDGFHA